MSETCSCWIGRGDMGGDSTQRQLCAVHGDHPAALGAPGGPGLEEITCQALTAFFYVASRDYDISGADFARVVREHVVPYLGQTLRFSDDDRRQWSAELAAEFVANMASSLLLNAPEKEKRHDYPSNSATRLNRHGLPSPRLGIRSRDD